MTISDRQRGALRDWNHHALTVASHLARVHPALAHSMFGLSGEDIEHLAKTTPSETANVAFPLFTPYNAQSLQFHTNFFAYMARAHEDNTQVLSKRGVLRQTDTLIVEVIQHLFWYILSSEAAVAAHVLSAPITAIRGIQRMTYGTIQHWSTREDVRFCPNASLSSGDDIWLTSRDLVRAMGAHI